MPKVTIWIREQDHSKWQEINDKPQFISDAINGFNQIDSDEYNKAVDRFKVSKTHTKNISQVINLLPGDTPNGNVRPDFSDDPTYTDMEPTA